MKAADRLNKLLIHFDITPVQLSRELGYDRPETVYRVQQGKVRSISRDLANRIVLKYPQINRTWLTSGIGDMLLSEPEVRVNEQRSAYNTAPNMLEVLREQLAEKDKQIDQLQNRIKEMIDYLKKREEQERQK